MHPPFRPRLAARSNPKNGIFTDSPQELRELSAAIDADSSLISRRHSLAQMLMERGEDKKGAYAEVDNTLYAAWSQAKPAERLKALRSATRQMKDKLKGDTRQESLTGETDDGEGTDREVVGVSGAQAEESVGAEDRERKLAEVLDSYGLTLELYTALVESSVTQEGRAAKRTDDAALAQQTGRSVKDIATLRRVAFMLSLHRRGDALLSADELEDRVSRVM